MLKWEPKRLIMGNSENPQKFPLKAFEKTPK